MKLKNKFHKINKYFLSFIIFVVFWLVFFKITGTITSGYHFTDNHQIIVFKKNIDEKGFSKTTEDIIKKDLNIRFRPLYYIHQIMLTRFFNTNLLFWSIHNVILAILTSFFLFLFINIQGYKFSYAVLFVFLTLIGTQTAIWWRLGPNETIGIFLLSVSLFFLANSVFKQKKYQLIISVFFMILSSMSKESFILFIPAYILLLLLFNYQVNTNKNIITIINKNIIVLICLSIIFFVEIYIIIFFVGANKLSYAGIDSFNLITFLRAGYLHLIDNIHIYLILIVAIFLLLRNIKITKINLKKRLHFIYNIIILLSIILPQFILYNKSGLYERYLLPLNLGFSFFIIYLLNKIFNNEKIILSTKKIFVVFIILISISLLMNNAVFNAKKFTKEGISTNMFLSSIVSNTNTNDTILIILSTYETSEWGASIDRYLKIVKNRKNINFLIENAEINTEYDKRLAEILPEKIKDIVIKMFYNTLIENAKRSREIEKRIDVSFSKKYKNIIVSELSNKYSCIAVLPSSGNAKIKAILNNNIVYKRVDFDNFTIYIKNKN